LKGFWKLLAICALALFETQATAQTGFPYCESFQTPSTQANTIFGGDAKLIGGVLRLTSNDLDQRGYIYIDVPFPSSYGVKVEFEYFSYGGTGQYLADGLSMFLFDGDSQSFQVGGFGGSLGYAPRDGEPGLSNAYLGIGLDEFGNFGNSAQGKQGGFSGIGQDELVPNAVVLRGPGHGSSGYPFVVGKRTTTTGPDGLLPGGQFQISSGGAGTQRVTDRNAVGYRKVHLELEPNVNGIGFFVILSKVVTTEQNLPRQITIFEHPYNYPSPKNLKIGFAASTGSYTNFHEIRNLIVEVSADDKLGSPVGTDISDLTACAGQENLYAITEDDLELPNENSVIRCLQFYESMEEIAAESGDICSRARCLEQNRFLVLPQGTFTASDLEGGFTFFPNEDFAGEEVTVYYTITDNYGKTSQGNAITLRVEESPRPIRLAVSGSKDFEDQTDICPGDTVVLQGAGEENYERFEWYKDGSLIEGYRGDSYAATEAGDYEIVGYNKKNCPAVSNSFRVNLPEFPAMELISPITGCVPAEAVDVAAHIPGFDTELYDYMLSGMGLTLYNEEIRSVGRSGVYELKGKLKNLGCYSAPISMEILIRDSALIAGFDFSIKGSGVKDDVSGGIFPDDFIHFQDLSDEGASEWDWDFGDGVTSSERNPTHVYGRRGEFTVRLLVTDQYGCQESAAKSISITKSYRLMVPTAFTPTLLDNKTFVPKHKGLAELELLIFNTWGELLFRTDDLETEGWDGYLNGKLLDAGVFVYRINGASVDGEVIKESGKFRLIR
jgi:hypothetical protein